MSENNKQLIDTIFAKHSQYDWGWHQGAGTSCKFVRGCWFAYEDRNGVSHRIDGHDKENLLERIKAL